MLNSNRGGYVLCAAMILAGISTQAFAQGPLNIGVVDRDKVVTSYPKAQSAAEELKRSEDKVHKMIEDSNKQYEDQKTAHKPQAELEGLQRRLQTQIDAEVKKIQDRAQGLEAQLESDIDSAIKAEAANKRVDAVFMKQAVLLGGTDLTEGVVKRLTAVTNASSGKSQVK
jgi:Skp family chaperone for outer membrane proteins